MQKFKLNAGTKLTREEMKKTTGGLLPQQPAGWICWNYSPNGAYYYWIQADTAPQADAQCHSNCVSNPACAFACGGPGCT